MSVSMFAFLFALLCRVVLVCECYNASLVGPFTNHDIIITIFFVSSVLIATTFDMSLKFRVIALLRLSCFGF